MGAEAYGTELGSSDFTGEALTTVFWVLCLGGSGWLIMTALFTKSLGKLESKVSTTKGKNVMPVVTTAAFLGGFGFFVTDEAVTSSVHTVVALSSGCTMVLALLFADKMKIRWIKEWALGFSIIAGLVAAYILT